MSRRPCSSSMSNVIVEYSAQQRGVLFVVVRPVLGDKHQPVELNINIEHAQQDDEDKFIEAIVRGLTCSLSVDELASICCQSLSTFKRHFRLRYSLSPHRWFIEHRLLIARYVVEHTVMPTKDIAHLCCFSSVSRFIDLFKQRYGATPSQLRRQCSAANELHDTRLEIVIKI